ncbi:hypothetical protein CNMCM6936_008641 [Aspergillus lentulus]|nr:hypothetical protein CNMCM6069_006791 [Aspergillus lentulus]KAF4169281.1 hypothetical protein CNMCM6936_008641 [Aspergillus lentulus]KAF4180890.1 hypothetical protein CNMCM8060_000365 [Aspergillus lentulus]KAF4189281.1 hypothetical protein CNMCM7927_008569 [Aspergillus lentulus]KAF4197446.1 hypothetical protein CNMCM8694_002712 [Aspergillus lentulus]
METIRSPYLKSLAHRGYVQGVTITSKATNTPLCRFFGGIRYGLAPSRRWRRAQRLPSDYAYGTRDQPGQCDRLSGVCPQPPFMNVSFRDEWTEDCFQCNVWVPVAEPPKKGWPVFVFIHGGFLQFGTPNTFSAAAFLGETDFNAIIVMPAYRLGVFGFLSSSEIGQDAGSVGETVGNHGFWDQRLALEWTTDNIALFGGNPLQVTISGYSAGAYSVFYQLAYDLELPPEQSVVKQACIWSNSPGVQPKNEAAAQLQFNQLLSALKIPASLAWTEKLSRLRSIPARTLLDAATSIELHQFRPTSDGTFIDPSLFKSLDNGTFARKLAARNIRIMLGECRDEQSLYATWHPPQSNTLQSLHRRLLADYPRHIADALIKIYCPHGQLPPGCENWHTDAFGLIYADMQVHKTQRGLIHALAAGNAGHLLYRYRIEKRLRCADRTIPPSWGVTHATDQYLWFWGNGEALQADEKPMVREAFIDPLTRFVRGDADADIGWGTGDYRQLRTLRPDGSVQICEDGLWDEAMRVWRALREVGEPDGGATSAKL